MLILLVSAATAVVAVAASGLGVLLWIRGRVFVTEVLGESMLPTLSHGDRMLAVRAGRDTVFSRSQLVVLRDPEAPVVRDERNRRRRNYLVKRVVAVAGEPLPEGVAHDTGTVPEGHLVVMGDNLGRSRDSRDFGPVPVVRVAGTVLRRLEG
ncbi:MULTISPECIES: S26 family signal peptidase [unclassified Nocardiopsis]|uniref:S26 family signal peptidase n=1 Tax=unclassified Nocardiopsis TaxID=2649073 RepID=UPI001356F7A6|nr:MULTISPECIES: S26 family signal peptidase [unclassified Nocardiopsis]